MLSDQQFDRLIAEEDYMGITGWRLLQAYPYLAEYPPGLRKRKMHDLAVHQFKMSMLCKSLGFEPRKYCPLLYEQE